MWAHNIKSFLGLFIFGTVWIKPRWLLYNSGAGGYLVGGAMTFAVAPAIKIK